MGRSKPNQIRYNDKISAIRVAINREKFTFIEAVRSDIQRLLERRSPEDIGDLKRSWRVVLTNKHKLAGRSLAKLTKAQPISVGISIESTARHAVMQMFGWNAKPGQLLTGFKEGSRWRIVRASRPIFAVPEKKAREKKRKREGGLTSFITKGGHHEPDPNLAFEKSGGHSIKSEIKRIVARRLKECKYLSSAVFMEKDVANVWTENKAVGRIAQWMQGTLSVELNSMAVDGISGSYSPDYKPH